MKATVLILLLSVAALTVTAQTSPPTGVLEGTVLQEQSPLARARVILTTTSQTRTAVTDDSGRFSLRDLMPGEYQLVATRDGYVRASLPVTMAAGQIKRDITLSLVPAGAISGRIVNARGEPFANVAVRALQYMSDSGKPVLTAVAVVRTNDLGEYRLYYLQPGTYLVSAIPPLGPRIQAQDAGSQTAMAGVEVLPGNPAGRDAATATRSGIFTTARQLTRLGFLSTADTRETYATSFFPGTPDASAASLIRIEAGSTASSIDFLLAPVPAVTIRGQIINSATGQPQGNAAVVLLSPGNGSDGIPLDQYGSVSATGAFEFRGIPPGVYNVVASVGRLPNGIPSLPRDFPGGATISRDPLKPPAAANVVRMAGRSPLNVGSVDLDRVTVSLHPGFTINGRLTVEGQSPVASEAMTSGVIIQLQPDPPDIVPESHPSQRVQTASLPATVGVGGAFAASGVFSGIYQIGILNAVRLPEKSYVKSVRFGNADALSPRLRIDDSPQGTLEILIGTNPGILEVAVVNERQMPAPAITVVLVPDSAQAQRYDLYRTAMSDDSGRARFANVVPGSYTAFALEGNRKGEWWDPEFVRRNEGLGRPAVVKDGATLSVDLKSIPAESGQ